MMIRLEFTENELAEFKEALCLVITAAKASRERKVEIGFTIWLGRVIQKEESARERKAETFPVRFTEKELAQAEAALWTLAVFFDELPDPAAREAAARLHWAAGKLDEARRSKYEAKAAKAAARAAGKPEGRFANIATAVVIGAILGGFLFGSIF
jgi:hypothetical protein